MKITDVLGDTLEVEIYHSGVHGEVVSVCSKTGRVGHPAWLTYEQAEELERELVRLRMAHEAEELKQVILKAEQELLQAKKVAAAEAQASQASYEFATYSSMGFAQAVNPEPEATTFHITINGDDVTIWKE